jgi:GT2 family glycosyltransferase
MAEHAEITAIVTAFRRINVTIDTLKRLEACCPSPAEIIVHVDANETSCADAVRAAFPHLIVLVSETPVGPGGGRNKLMAASSNELVASFDDDSYPIDRDFFARAVTVAASFPDAALIGASIVHVGEVMTEDARVAGPTASFGAGGVVFRRTPFLEAGGFVPLVVAYGMEEEDLSLRLIDRGWKLVYSPWLRVFHNTDRSHHASARITAGTISNLALLAWLRYPVRYWPYGILQIANRVVWCLRNGRRAGVLSGLASIPMHVGRHLNQRRPVTVETMRVRGATRRGQFGLAFAVRGGPVSATRSGQA